MNSEKILDMLPKLKSLDERRLQLVFNAVNSCLTVQYLEEEYVQNNKGKIS